MEPPRPSPTQSYGRRGPTHRVRTCAMLRGRSLAAGMNVVVRTAHLEAEITIHGGAGTTLAQLIEHVTERPAPPVVDVDGRAVPATALLDGGGLFEGSTIDLEPAARPELDHARVELVQVAGTGTGAAIAVDEGTFRVGPGRRLNAAELELAPVEMGVFDLVVGHDGSASIRPITPGARLDGHALTTGQECSWRAGLLDAEERTFMLTEPARRARRDLGRPGPGGTVAYNRPPSTAAAPVDSRVQAPDRQPGAARVGAGAMARFREVVRERSLAERDYLRAVHLDVASAMRVAEVAGPPLWQRRASDPFAFHVPLGLGDVAWRAQISGAAPPECQAVLDEFAVLPTVPVAADLATERGLGLVGSTASTRALGRAVMLGAAVLHGPVDLDITVLTHRDRLTAWEWVKWLPHTRRRHTPAVLTNPEQVRSWIASASSAVGSPSAEFASGFHRIALVVVDEPDWWLDRDAPLRPLLADPAVPFRLVALAGSVRELPAICTTVVEERPGRVATVDGRDGRACDALRPFLVSEAAARHTARCLAALDDPDATPPSDDVPAAAVTVAAVLGITADPGAIAERWRAVGRGVPAVPVGSTDAGLLRLDLRRHGPHAIVVGATGAGVAELLRNLVLGLAVEAAPDQVNVVLVDGSDDTAFAGLTDLPHVAGVVHPVEPESARRLLDGLRTEVIRRESAATVVPLVVVIHDLGSLRAALPDATDVLAELTVRGGAVGVHVVMSELVPAGGRPPDARLLDASSIRIALRLDDAAVSVAVLGTPDATAIPRHAPGRGLVRLGRAAPHAFATAAAGTSGNDDLDLQPYVLGRDLTTIERRLVRRAIDSGRRAAIRPNGSDALSAAIAAAADQLGGPPVRSVMAPPLPDDVAVGDLLARHPGDAVPFAVGGVPGDDDHAICWWQPLEDGVVVSGGDAATRTDVVAALVLGLVTRFAADDVHVYLVHREGSRLGQLARAPHVGATVTLGDDKVAALVTLLDDESHARDVGDGDRPLIVVVVDGLDDRHVDEPSLRRLRELLAAGRRLGIVGIVGSAEPAPSELTETYRTRIVLHDDGPPGRATLAGGAQVQAARAPADLDAAVRDLGAEPAGQRPPRRVS